MNSKKVEQGSKQGRSGGGLGVEGVGGGCG